MISEETGQGLATNLANRENKRLSPLSRRFSTLRRSRLARHWRLTILPALLIVLVLFVLNWRLRSRLGPEEPFSDFTFPYEQTFDDVQINRWFSSGGRWTVQAGALLQADESEEPAKLFVPKWLPQGEPYHLAVDLTLPAETQAAGINFNAQYPAIQSEYQRIAVARNGDQLQLLAGTVNEVDGFQAETTVLIPSPTETLHLDLVVENEAYDVLVNGQMLVQKRPLTNVDGLIGLFVLGGTARFDNLMLDAADESFNVREIMTETEAVGDVAVVPEVAPTTVPAAAAKPVAEEPLTAQVEPTVQAGVATQGLYGTDRVENVASGAVVAPTPVVATAVDAVDANSGSLTVGIDDWVTISGEWQAQDGKLVQSDKNGFDLALGYAGSAFSAVDLTATLAHLEGTGAGILFNMPAANNLQGAHMVRYADWADALVWGYFDEAGQFNGQGYAKIEAPGPGEHTIGVSTSSDGYTVYLDDRQLATNVPLLSDNGHIGLITSQAKAAFGPVQIGSGERVAAGVVVADQAARAPEKPGDIFGDIETISGEWVREGTKLSQLNPATYDFSISTGVYAGVYTLETAISLPQDALMADAGGGILFHMPERDSRTGAYMVRLAGRDELIWGYYDQNGAFVGQGRQQLEAADQTTHNVKVIVDKGTYRIVVDGNDIAQNVPLKQDEGWIGLVSYRGPVAFDGISVTFGTAE